MEGNGRGLFKVLSRYLSGWTDEQHERPQLGWLVPGPRTEPETSRIRSRNANP